jgi:replicative DNA helicase
VSPNITQVNDATTRFLATGREFILQAPDHIPAVWGEGEDVLWAGGESLLIVGPDGVGKTTLMQQLVLRRAGVRPGGLIGFPVAADTEQLTLYLAMDRPQQIARSFKRMVTDADGDALENIIIWKAPMTFDLIRRPEALLEQVVHYGQVYGKPVGTVAIDSLKDLVPSLDKDEGGAAVHRAVSHLIAANIEVVAAHHQRKAHTGNAKPTSLADVYGSRWITAGAGSILMMWGDPGDSIVELTHIKQPAQDVGPIELELPRRVGLRRAGARLREMFSWGTWISEQRTDCGVGA